MKKDLMYLPEGYTLSKEIDLQKDKKAAIIVNVMAVVIMAAMVILGMFISSESFFYEKEISIDLFMLLVVIIAVIIYMLLHEAVHGVFIKLFCGHNPQIGAKLPLYLFAGQKDAYFSKWRFCIIALSPVVIWGIVLLGLNILLPQYFWAVYFIQAINIGGAAGDYYVTYILLSKMPKDVLVNDDGLSMRFYTKKH